MNMIDKDKLLTKIQDYAEYSYEPLTVRDIYRFIELEQPVDSVKKSELKYIIKLLNDCKQQKDKSYKRAIDLCIDMLKKLI